MQIIAAPTDDELEPRVVYRRDARQWWGVAVMMLGTAGTFAFACLSQLGEGPLRQAEIAKKHVENEAGLVWMFSGIGLLLLFLLVHRICGLLFFRVVADENGVRWRPFLAWQSARWDEISDCVLRMPPGASGADIVTGKRKITLNPRNPHWPALRDFVAARVKLPDGLAPWHELNKLSADERRALTPKTDDGATLMARSSWGEGAILGTLLCGFYAFSLHNEAKNIRPSSFVFLFAAVGIFVLWPIVSQIRDFIRADDDGLLIGQISRKRRVRWGDIEDLFLLKTQGKHRLFWRPYVVVAGETIALPPLGKMRDAMLHRIEARAIYSSSRQFERREFAPVGKTLTLPATFEAQPNFASVLRQNALLATVFAGSAALMAGSVTNVGWENFGSSRGMLVWASALWALLLGAWLRRLIQKSMTRRARGTYRIVADDAGLSLENARGFVRIEWAQIARLERDCTRIWDTIFRIESANGATIEWDRGLAKSGCLTSVAREKSGHEWQDSARVSRLMSGIERTNDALLISDNNVISRYWAWAWLGMWALIPSVQICSSLFNPAGDRNGVGLLFLLAPPILAPPIGFVLYLGIAVLLSIARVRTRCDAAGLTHRGWFVTREMKWQDVAEVGLGGNGFWDFVRARDGKIMRIWMFPLAQAGNARRELRAEITHRAPHARGGWKMGAVS